MKHLFDAIPSQIAILIKYVCMFGNLDIACIVLEDYCGLENSTSEVNNQLQLFQTEEKRDKGMKER